jgi:hypothetical protein
MILLLLLIDVTNKLVLVLLLPLPHYFIVVCLFWFCLMGKLLLTHVFIVKTIF